MLTIQRASAGSGKTYALAKKYLWFLLTVVPSPGKARRLRRAPELADAASHILAVTFTNKATNEMKARIVDKLAALASAGAGAAESDPMKPDYMREFCEQLHETPQRIAEAAGVALRELLNAYGDFHVTTIDSFFQTVLRTFAYETELNDNYSLELDSNYVANVGMEGMLEEINDGTPSPETRYWIGEIMARAAERGENWNVFQRSTASIYTRLLGVVQRMEKEDFKLVRVHLDRYFEQNPDLRTVYEHLCERYENPIREAHAEMQHLAREIQKLCLVENRSLKEDTDRFLNGRIEKALKTLWHSERSATGEKADFTVSRRPAKSDNVLSVAARPNLKGSAFADTLFSLVLDFYDAHDRWRSMITTGDSGLWMIYRHNFPYLGLLQCVRGHIREFRETNNTLELGETNSMLRRIIGEDDAPFIYERLGSRLNHFLIDEFQDTSLLQWHNLHPLLSESESRGHDNLIIGDAKQSIYRFRNADPSLITTVVPEAFPDHQAAGMSVEENTNWRSDLHIVRFNNFFFHALARYLDADGKVVSPEGGPDRTMESLYANTVQYSHHREQEGYVEINLLVSGSVSEGDEEEDEALRRIPELINTLRSRGYRQRDIALLVETHSDENDVVQALIEHNQDTGPEHPAIDFLSEGSLTLGASEAVCLIIDTLEAICAAVPPHVREGQERRRKGVADWDAIRCSFNFFALEHPEMAPAEQLEAFLKAATTTDVISEMLGSMQAVALPAIIEAVTEKFIPAPLRDADAPYLAMLQDAVDDYCQGYSADIASFLDWWRLRGHKLTISSPEETDAVRIMTIHKSKGLEFPVVILPYGATSFDTSVPATEDRQEWRWVHPQIPDAFHMPPYVPIRLNEDLVDTVHQEELDKYRYLKRMDKLNTAYVAFTRAVHELYIFAPVNLTKEGEVTVKPRLGSTLYHLLSGIEDETNGPENEMPAPEEIIIDHEGMRISYGQPRFPAENPDESTENPGLSDDPTLIKGYYVNSGQAILQYSDAEVPPTLSDEGDEDPRSEGNLMHAAMADVHVIDDIPRAVRRLRVKGLISHSRVAELIDTLTEAVRSVKDRGWFDPSWRVANERPVLSNGHSDRRPDRLLISADGRHAVVIDYKFGAYHSDNRYRRQVEGYKQALLDTGAFDTVTGYLWYVPLRIVEAV